MPSTMRSFRAPVLAVTLVVSGCLAAVGAGGQTAAASPASPGTAPGVVQVAPQADHGPRSKPKSKSKKARIRVTVRAPKGLPATVTVGTGASRRVVAKPLQKAATRTTLTVRPGRWAVKATTVVVNGTVLKPSIHAKRVKVRAGKTSKVTVRFRRVKGLARGAQLTQLTSTAIGLRWKSGKKVRSVVRLTSGSAPAMSVKAGRPVKVTKKRQAVAGALTPGATYTLSVFTRAAGSWRGPVPFTVGTLPVEGQPGAEFVAAQDTFLGSQRDVVGARSTGTGVAVRFRDRAPLVGAAVVLPPAAGLPQGYVGTVSAISTSGEVSLEQASLSDAFDYLSMSVPNLAAVPATDVAPSARRGARPAARGFSSVLDASCKDRPKKADDPKSIAVTEDADKLEGYDFARTIALTEKGLTAEIGASVSVDLVGSFDGDILTHSKTVGLFGHGKKLSIPYGATVKGSFGVTGDVDAGIAITASKGADKSKDGSYDCTLSFPRQAKTFMAGPVPLTLSFEVKAEVGISGTIKVEHIGATVGTMVRVDGQFGIGIDDKFTGTVDPVASMHTPIYGAEAAVEASASATVAFGPGVADGTFGAMAGIEGSIAPLKLGLKAGYDTADKFCSQFTVGGSASLDLLARVWYHGVGPDFEWTSKRLSLLPESWRQWSYFDTDKKPWDFPAGCADTDPTNSLDGGGVDLTDPVLDADDGQIIRVDGLIPGQTTWVLSTGLADELIGEPDFKASTALDQPGSSRLSELIDSDTHDAASYKVTVKPEHKTLHVSFMFGSEEYPEYVDQGYNDVAAVYINGTNCAVVPGTSEPVSVNAINDHRNSQLYIDNSEVAAGYHTSLDGLTVPLTCDRAVTPGVPVQVEIVVADAGDGVLDSAVALVNRGIWSD